MRVGDGWATPLPDPPRGRTKRTLPCERCGACHCPCVTAREDVELLAAEVAKRHRKSLELADLSDFRAQMKAAAAAERRAS
jgi:hypothetical protein